MRFTIVFLLCFPTIFLESKSDVVDLMDNAPENDGILKVLSSDLKTVVLHWALTDGDTFTESYFIRVRSRCLNNMAERTRFRKKSQHGTEERYETVPDHIMLKEVVCETEEEYEYAGLFRKPNELKIYINQTVDPDVLNEIEVEKIPRHKSSQFDKKSAKTVIARSTSSHPEVSSSDSGYGCFQVFDISATSREVHIYWRPSSFYEVSIYIYEEGSLLYKAVGPWQENGSMTTFIGIKRHHFVFEFVNHVEEVKEKPKVVTIPPKYGFKLIQQLDIAANYDEATNLNTLIFPKVPDVTTTNYTIFLIDTIGEMGVVTNVTDFMYVPSNVTRVEIESDRKLLLGVSVNTERSSSGLYIMLPGVRW